MVTVERYALFDDAGFPEAFFASDVQGPRLLPIYGDAPEPSADDPSPVQPVIGHEPNPAIPEGAREISDADWLDLLAQPGRRRWDGSSIVPYEPPLPPIDLDAYLDQASRAHEYGGIVVSGVPVSTTDRSKTLVMGARLRVERDPSLTTKWAAADGQSYPLDAAAVIAVSDAIGTFVSACFDAYAEMKAGIADGTIVATDQIDAAFGAVEVAY